MVDVYRIHFEPNFIPKPEKNERKRMIGEEDDYTITARVSLRVLIGTGYRMPHRLVLRNLLSRTRCDACDYETNLLSVRSCDGRYPVLYGTDFPENADGRQFQCFRRILCLECDEKMTDRGEDLWFCSVCKAPPATVEDALGTGIEPPSFLRSDGVIPSSSWPKGGTFGLPNEHPADRWLRLVRERQQTKERILHRRKSADIAQMEVNSSATFLRKCRSRGMNRGDMGTFLEILHEIHGCQDLLIDGGENQSRLALPKDIRTVEARADRSVYLDDDIEIQERHFDQSSLGQQCKMFSVYVTDPKLALQALLLEARPGTVFLQKRGGLRPNIVDSEGTPLFGYELFLGSRWSDLLQTIKHGVFLLGFTIHSDVMNVGLHNYYPISISCANVPHADRTKRNGNIKFAMSKNPIIRLARGTKVAENLSEECKVEKYNLQSLVMAEILAFIDNNADQVFEFLVRDVNGDLQRYQFMIRMVTFEADLEEIKHVLGLKGHICALCLGLVNAIMKGKPGSDFGPCMRLEQEYFCATSKRRTPLNYVRGQAQIALLRRQNFMAEATLLANELHLRPFVRNSLLVLTNILPHEAGGPYTITGPDRLHGIGKGSARTMSLTADYFMRVRLIKSASYKSPQDVRAFQDSCLSQCGNHYGHINFHSGVWGSDKEGGSLKGNEQIALCRLLPYTFLGSEQRMQNTNNFRKQFLEHYHLFLKLVAEFGTPQFYSEEDLARLRSDVQSCLKGFEWCQTQAKGFVTEGERNELKNGFDTLKVHLLGAADEAIRRVGSLICIDTEIGERNMLDIREQHETVQDNDKAVLSRTHAVRMDAAIAHFENYAHGSGSCLPTSVENPPEFRGTRSRIGSGATWAKHTDLLQLGVYGPALTEHVTQELFVFLRSSFTDNFGDFDGQSASKVDDAEVSYIILKPGVTVKLKNGAYCQIIIPKVMGIVGGDGGVCTDLGAVPTACVSQLSSSSLSTKSGMHPELPVPFLVRKEFTFLPLHEIDSRAHIIPYFGELYLSPHIAPENHFTVDILGDPVFRAEMSLRSVVFWQCPLNHCKGRIRYIPNGPFSFKCPLCAFSFP